MIALLALVACRGPAETDTPSPPVDDPRALVPGTRWVGSEDLDIGHAIGGRFSASGPGEIAFEDVGHDVYIRDASLPGDDLAATARLRLAAPDMFEAYTRITPVGDIDGDGRDDLATFGLFTGLPDGPAQLNPDDASIHDWERLTFRCDVDSDGADDLCTAASVAFGPDWQEPDFESGTCEPFAFNPQGLSDGWDELFAAAQWTGDGRRVAFAMTHATALVEDPCALNAERIWTIPTSGGYPYLRTAELSGDMRTDIAIAVTTLESGEDGGIYVITGPEGTGDPADPADVRDAPIRIVVENERLIGFLHTGDFDGDGSADLVIGLDGEVRIYRGPFAPGALTPEDATARYRGDDDDWDTQFGTSGDVYDLDADGQDDVILTDRKDDEGGLGAGKIYIVWSGGIGSGTRNEPM
jgi:hypothetical protein